MVAAYAQVEAHHFCACPNEDDSVFLVANLCMLVHVVHALCLDMKLLPPHPVTNYLRQLELTVE